MDTIVTEAQQNARNREQVKSVLLQRAQGLGESDRIFRKTFSARLSSYQEVCEGIHQSVDTFPVFSKETWDAGVYVLGWYPERVYEDGATIVSAEFELKNIVFTTSSNGDTQLVPTVRLFEHDIEQQDSTLIGMYIAFASRVSPGQSVDYSSFGIFSESLLLDASLDAPFTTEQLLSEQKVNARVCLISKAFTPETLLLFYNTQDYSLSMQKNMIERGRSGFPVPLVAHVSLGQQVSSLVRDGTIKDISLEWTITLVIRYRTNSP